MRAVPADIQESALAAAVAAHWGFAAEKAEYAAVGGGSYHWVLTDREGARRFATLDDLDRKAWLGNSRDSVCAGLQRAFETAIALQAEDLTFVVAPVPTRDGEALCRLGPRHTVALFPYLEGQAGVFDGYDSNTREALPRMLAELHRATPAVTSLTRRIGLDLPGRSQIESALGDLHRTWTGGPLAEPARRVLSHHAADVAALLSLGDRLSSAIEGRDRPWVVTHGEPHAANVMQVADVHFLIDWDTVGLAPRERDLWMLSVDGAGGALAYCEAIGQDLDQEAVDFFRLAWDLSDLAEYLNVLRSLHSENEDTTRALAGLTNCAGSREQWQAFLG